MARLLDVSPQTVNNWRKHGDVPAHKARAFSTHARVSIKRIVPNWRDYWPELAGPPGIPAASAEAAIEIAELAAV